MAAFASQAEFYWNKLSGESTEVIENMTQSDFSLQQLLEVAVLENKPDLVEFALHWTDPNFINPETALASLHQATARQDPNSKVVEKLLEAGARVDLPTTADAGAQTALHFAAQYGDETTLRVLLEKSPNLECKNALGWTPLLVAVSKGHVLAALALIEAGANVNTHWQGETPLHFAARLIGWRRKAPATKQVNVELIQILLGAGAQVNAPNSHCETALHIAAKEGLVDIALFLLEKKADATALTKAGKSPITLAREKNFST